MFKKTTKTRITSCIFCCMSSESFRIWNVPSFTFELLSAFLRVVGEKGYYFFFSFFNLYNEQSVPGVSNYSAIHWQVERYWFCISCVHYPSSSPPLNMHDDFTGRESFFPRPGHFIQALSSFLLLSLSKGLFPLEGGKIPKPVWQIHPARSAGTSNSGSGEKCLLSNCCYYISWYIIIYPDGLEQDPGISKGKKQKQNR